MASRIWRYRMRADLQGSTIHVMRMLPGFASGRMEDMTNRQRSVRGAGYGRTTHGSRRKQCSIYRSMTNLTHGPMLHMQTNTANMYNTRKCLLRSALTHHTGHLAFSSRPFTPSSASLKYCLAREIWNFIKERHLSSIFPVDGQCMPASTCAEHHKLISDACDLYSPVPACNTTQHGHCAWIGTSSCHLKILKPSDDLHYIRGMPAN